MECIHVKEIWSEPNQYFWHAIAKDFVFIATLKAVGMKENEEWGDAKAPTKAHKIMTKNAKASTAKNPPPRREENEEEEKDVATNLGGAVPRTNHFTMTNMGSDEDNWQINMNTCLSLPLSFFLS